MTEKSWTERLIELGVTPELECRNTIIDRKRLSQTILHDVAFAELIGEFGSTVIDNNESRKQFLNYLMSGNHSEDPFTFILFSDVINRGGLFLPNWDMMLGRFAEVILLEPRHKKMAWVNPYVQWIKFNSAMLLSVKYLNDITEDSYLEGFFASLENTINGNRELIRRFISICKTTDDFTPLFRTFRLLDRRLQEGGPHVHHPRHIESIIIQLQEVSELLIADGEAENHGDTFPHFLYFLAELSEISLKSLISMYSNMGVMSDEDFENTKYFIGRQFDITSTGAEYSKLASHESLEIDFLNMKFRVPTLFGSPFQVADLIDIDLFCMGLDYVHTLVLTSENSDTPLYRSIRGQIRESIGWYQTFYNVFEKHPDWTMIKTQAELRYVVELTGSVEAAMAWWPKNEEEMQNRIKAGFEALIDYDYEK